MLVFAISYHPISEGDEYLRGRLLLHRTFEVTIVIVTTVLVFCLVEFFCATVSQGDQARDIFSVTNHNDNHKP